MNVDNDNNFVSIVVNGPKVDNYLEGQLQLMEAYQTTYNIYNHIEQAEKLKKSSNLLVDKKPFSTIAFHEAESLSELHFKTFLTRFAKSKIGELFNMSIEEALNYPKSKLEIMFKVSEEIHKEKVSLDKNVLDSLTKVQNNLKK